MQPHHSYFIYATPRSGSFLLCEALSNTGLAGYPAEYFNHENARMFRKGKDIIDYAHWIHMIKEAGTTSNGVFGAKIIWMNFEDMIDYLHAIPGNEKLPLQQLFATNFLNLQAIWIRRRDTVRQAISYSKALQTKIWITTQNQYRSDRQKQSTPKLTFHFQEIDFLVRCLQKDEEEMQQYFTTYGIEPFTVIYEDFVQSYEETALHILDFLRISRPANLLFGKRVMQKQADAQSEEWVQRYYQLRQERGVSI